MACQHAVLDAHFLGVSAVATVGYQLLFFIIAAFFEFDTVTDFAGGTNFVLVSVLTLLLGASYYPRQILATTAATLWGVRLSGYLLYRIVKIGKDDRFDDKKRGFSLEFATFWVLQAVWVFLVSSPVVELNSRCTKDTMLVARDWVGLSMWLCGWLLESVADQQKFAFRNDPQNKGKFCCVGLWGVSRHPNYFGEMILWWGLFITCSTVFQPSMYWSIAGPGMLTLLLLFVSGVNLLEESSNKRYGALPEYREYKASVSNLIPFPPSIFRRLPPLVKTLLFFEWPMYARHLPDTEPQPGLARGGSEGIEAARVGMYAQAPARSMGPLPLTSASPAVWVAGVAPNQIPNSTSHVVVQPHGFTA